jgi:hypothetical protein
VQVRFHNNGGKSYARAELHLAYAVPKKDGTKVTYAWTDDKGAQQATHAFASDKGKAQTWDLATGQNVQATWVEFSPEVPSK